MEHKAISAVVVTYNRKALLMECLEAILNQTYPVDKIILIDNASTDGTQSDLKEKGYLDLPVMEYVLMEKNTGGSGGFYEGLSRARNMHSDWVWIMDDDTIPEPDCLLNMIKASDKIKESENKPISFMASSVYGASGEYMNVPGVDTAPTENGYPDWYRYLASGIIEISTATFVSLLINGKAIERCGLPCKDYFIWGDDSEYTTRLTRFFGPAFLVGDSVAIHKRNNAKSISIDNENDPKRMEMYHYWYRNKFITGRYYGSIKKARRYFWKSFFQALKYLSKEYGKVKCKIIIKGSYEGLREYDKFKSYIDEQIKSK